VQAAVAASADLNDVPSNLDPSLADAPREGHFYIKHCMEELQQVEQPECAMGDTASKTTVALIGDSNAFMWIRGFQQVAAHRHWRLEMATEARCPVLDLPRAECDHWRGETIRQLQTEHPKLIVVGMSRRYGIYGIDASFTSYEPPWLDSLTRLVRQLRGTGAKVLVLGPIPDPQLQVPTCLSEHLDHATACSVLRSVAANEPGIAAESAAVKAGGGQYADLTDLFCTAERCPAIIGNTMVYFDRGHVTMEYARLLAPVLGALADRALVGG
jgi:hypothetical protein